MIHYKQTNRKDCTAHDLIIGNNCGLVCANCGACKCQNDKRPTSELDTLERLEQRRLLLWEENRQMHAGNPITCYSYPKFELQAIEERKKLIKE